MQSLAISEALKRKAANFRGARREERRKRVRERAAGVSEQQVDGASVGASQGSASSQPSSGVSDDERLESKQNPSASGRRLAAAKRGGTPAPEGRSESERTDWRPVLNGDVPPLMPLPERLRRRGTSTLRSFIALVMVPTLIASVYYTFVASDQYVSEFRFAVRDSKSAAKGNSGDANISGLLAGMSSPNGPENYIVVDYLKSRQAVDDLMEKIDVKSKYTRSSIDWWSRFDASKPMEAFAGYWQSMITANYDQVTGIAIAQVRAFSPGDAHELAVALLDQSEELINRIANRPQLDAIESARAEVKHAEARLEAIRAELLSFRNTEQVIDPNASIVTSNIATAQMLRTNLTQLLAELGTLRERLDEKAPSVQVLQSKIRATQEQLSEIEKRVANGADGSKSLSTVVARFEQLELDRQFAQTQLLTAMQSLERARMSALEKHMYVTPFVQPVRAESPSYPRRLLSIMVTMLFCFLLWTISLLVFRSIREHLT